MPNVPQDWLEVTSSSGCERRLLGSVQDLVTALRSIPGEIQRIKVTCHAEDRREPCLVALGQERFDGTAVATHHWALSEAGKRIVPGGAVWIAADVARNEALLVKLARVLGPHVRVQGGGYAAYLEIYQGIKTWYLAGVPYSREPVDGPARSGPIDIGHSAAGPDPGKVARLLWMHQQSRPR